jgi:hypothetical protein
MKLERLLKENMRRFNTKNLNEDDGYQSISPQTKYGIMGYGGKYIPNTDDLPILPVSEYHLVELEWFSDDNYEIVDTIRRGGTYTFDESQQHIYDENSNEYEQMNINSYGMEEIFDTEEEADEVFEDKYAWFGEK